MRVNDSDRDWELLGRTDPYFAVLTAPEYHGQLSPSARTRFFESGEQHIATMFSLIRDHLDRSFAPRRSLDFGCGVGRLLIPLASRCEEVVGVDVSASMLAEARRNCETAGASNVKLVPGNDELSVISGSFDFVHSYIVLQHIPPSRGQNLIARLASLLAHGGVAMLHVTYESRLPSAASRYAYWARLHIPGAAKMISLIRGRSSVAPIMQMNEYSLTRILDLLARSGCPEVYVRFSVHGGSRGVLLFARKSDAAVFT